MTKVRMNMKTKKNMFPKGRPSSRKNMEKILSRKLFKKIYPDMIHCNRAESIIKNMKVVIKPINSTSNVDTMDNPDPTRTLAMRTKEAMVVIEEEEEEATTTEEEATAVVVVVVEATEEEEDTEITTVVVTDKAIRTEIKEGIRDTSRTSLNTNKADNSINSTSTSISIL